MVEIKVSLFATDVENFMQSLISVIKHLVIILFVHFVAVIKKVMTCLLKICSLKS